MKTRRPLQTTILRSVLLVALAIIGAATLRAQPQLTEAQAAALRPTPPNLVPRSTGTFWLISHLDWPPQPGYPYPQYPDLPTYLLPDGSWLVDDTSVPLPPPASFDAVAAARSLLLQSSLASQQLLNSAMLSETSVPEPPDPTNSPPPPPPSPPQLIPPPTPTNGTFWLLVESNWPPLPWNPCTNCDVYALSDGSYLVDDTPYTWPPPNTNDTGGAQWGPTYYGPTDLWLEITGVTNSVANLILHGTASGTPYTILTRQTWSPADPWDAEQPLVGAEGKDYTTTQIPTFGRRVLFLRALVGTATPTRLWLYVVGITNNCFNAVLHGTTEDTSYDLRSVASLSASNNWALETNFPGATGQYWTPVSIPLLGRPSLFLSARSWIDADGNGIPDWWEQTYLGTNGVDPYALCPSGDGWTLLQAYQNGWDPNLFYTPPPPQNVRAQVDSTRTNVTITWASGGGPVTNYVIEKGWYLHDDTSFTYAGQVGPATFTFSIVGANPSPGTAYLQPAFRVRAYFTNGANALSQSAPALTPGLTVAADVIRGPGGHLYLTVSALPPSVTTLRLFAQDSFFGQWPGIDIPASNIVNGVMLLPETETQPLLPYRWWWLQAFTTSGAFGDIDYAEPTVAREALPTRPYTSLPPTAYTFLDASPHLKENLKFLLRSATVNRPFSYASDRDANGGDSGSATPASVWSPEDYCARPASPLGYEYYGFHYFSSNLNYSIMRELRPVHENYLWRNFVFDPQDYDATGAGHFSGDCPPSGLRALNNALHVYAGCGTETNLPLAFSSASAQWLYFHSIRQDTCSSLQQAEVGVSTNSNNRLVLGDTAHNCYGLSFNSVKLTTTGLPVLEPGIPSTFPPPSQTTFYPETAAPALQTADYYFASQTPYFNYNYYYGTPRPPLPGSPDFSVTNTSPLLITGLGQPITVSGWAKQAIVNGYSGNYAYLEQYFDQSLHHGHQRRGHDQQRRPPLPLWRVLPHAARPSRPGHHARPRHRPARHWRRPRHQTTVGCEPRRHHGPQLRRPGQHLPSPALCVLAQQRP